MPHQRPVLAAAGTLALLIGLGVGTVACGDDAAQSDAGQFCGQAKARRDMIVNPPMATQAELNETLDFYRLMGRLAPLAISQQWNDIVHAMETADTVVPGDPDSEQRVAIQAYATERSAYEVSVWLKRNCGVDIPIVTIAAQDPVPARTTTVPSVPGTTAAP